MLDRAMFPEAIFTMGEVATMLQISRRHVQWLIKTRALGSVKLGRSYRVRSRHLQAFLDAHELSHDDPAALPIDRR
jgi:excisionase family DNA binding protein